MEKRSTFFEITYNETTKAFCYRSGMMVYEETLVGGMLVSAGYNSAGYPLNVLTNYTTRLDPSLGYEPSSFHLEINGQCAHYDLCFVDFSVDQTDRLAHSVLTLDSLTLPIRIKVHTLVDGSAVFTRFLEIENRSDEIMKIIIQQNMMKKANHTQYMIIQNIG